ncbi:putative SvtR-like protein [Sulfolobales Mexican rudivirus 1]|uniref:SvtR-like protein n=1 Tax=Sulfolobales Mexican rod-shaped virus 1 TaxID=2848122 RepID=K4NWU1_9VIRU|nr:putative SvtR-like protein [Sulfolobales Mexican rudivirus 1]AFV51229.1 putative SvtR-like protein [Sulfolobales Mexican rod-shaped virus 1]
MDGQFFDQCLKALQVPDDIPRESLSYSEKKAIEVCHQLDAGINFDLSEYEGIFDEERFQALLKLYLMKFNY